MLNTTALGCDTQSSNSNNGHLKVSQEEHRVTGPPEAAHSPQLSTTPVTALPMGDTTKSSSSSPPIPLPSQSQHSVCPPSAPSRHPAKPPKKLGVPATIPDVAVLSQQVILRDQFVALLMGTHLRCGGTLQKLNRTDCSQSLVETGPLAIRVVWDWVTEAHTRQFFLNFTQKGAPKNTLTPATLITFGVSLLTGAITSVQCWRDPRPRWHVLCANSSTVLYASDLSKNSRKFEVRKTNSGDELHTWDKNTGSYFVNGKWLVTEYRGVLDITPLWIGGQRREHLRVTDSFWFSHVRLSSNHAMPDEAVVGNFQYFFGLNSGFGTKLIVLDIARSWASGQFIELSSTTTKWHTQQWRYTDLLLLTQQSGDRCFIMGVKTGPDASVTIIAEGTGTAIPLVYHHPREVIDGIHQLSGSTFCVISGRSGRKERALTMWCDIWDCNNTSGALRSIELEQPIAVESLFAEGGLLFTVRTAQLSGNHVVQVTDPSSSGPPILCFTLPYRASVYHFSLLT